MAEIFERIERVIRSRASADPDGSYVARLLKGRPEAVLEKIGEEATELVIASMGGQRADIVHETADLWFHTLVLLAANGITHDEVMAELERRFGVSGLAEKAARERV